MNDPEDSPYTQPDAAPSIETAYRPRIETARILAYAWYLSVIPHRDNSPTRKYLTSILFLVWGASTLLWHLGHDPPAAEIYWAMTVLVFSIMSHLWGFEYGVLSAYELKRRDDPTQNGHHETDDREPENR